MQKPLPQAPPGKTPARVPRQVRPGARPIRPNLASSTSSSASRPGSPPSLSSSRFSRSPAINTEREGREVAQSGQATRFDTYKNSNSRQVDASTSRASAKSPCSSAHQVVSTARAAPPEKPQSPGRNEYADHAERGVTHDRSSSMGPHGLDYARPRRGSPLKTSAGDHHRVIRGRPARMLQGLPLLVRVQAQPTSTPTQRRRHRHQAGERRLGARLRGPSRRSLVLERRRGMMRALSDSERVGVGARTIAGRGRRRSVCWARPAPTSRPRSWPP